MRRIAPIILLLGLAAASGAETEYAALFIDDAKIGHSRMTRTVRADRVITASRTSLALSRFGATVEVTVETRYEETADGQPLAFDHTTHMGVLGMSTRGVVTDGRLRVTATGLGMPQDRVIDYPDGALMPEGVRLLTQRELARQAGAFRYVMFDPEGLRGTPTEVTLGKQTPVTLIGRIARLRAATVKLDLGGRPVVTEAFLDETGHVRKSTMALMGMRLDIVACDEAFAKSPNEQVDLTDGGSVASPTAIPRPRHVREAVFTLAPADKETRLILPNTGEQRVTAHDDGTVTVRVTKAETACGELPYPGADADVQSWLQPTAYVQSDHPRIIAEARRMVGDTRDVVAAAKKIEQWVHGHITNKTLTIGYASALETLDGKAGDCTEHAVLTAALCRAVGIPCRVVVGVAYVDEFGPWRNRFIGHAWNQVYAGDSWVGLDAALGIDASRIALSVGAGDPLDFVGIIHSLGNFTITAVQTK